MDAHKSKGKVLVRRITIDEKLSGNLIRALISPSLAKRDGEFCDGKEDWGEEKDSLIRPDDYASILGIPSSESEKWPWSDLQEGQVFLSGEFKVVGDEKKPERFLVNPGQKRFLRIDGLIKREMKQLYFRALKTERRS